MPCLAQKNDHHQFSNGSTKSLHALSCSGVSVSVNGVWSKNNDDVGHNQLQKFWSELSPQARKDLLRIDKQTFFEQARKNMYCSRCNGLLLEGFLQIVMYGRSFQQEGAIGDLPCGSLRASKHQHDGDMCVTSGCEDDVQEPSVYPWGGLTTTRDGVVTILDCYLHSKSLKGLQNVFDSARARERERELLYPDACGGGGRGWMSQGMGTYGRGYGTRETCALHTARLSVDTLVDFWSALGEETRQSLLRMKEEDFIERLMYRFDSKRFCRDCRRNVIRELKELKEFKRMRREPRCTNWFCVADTDFEYEVSHDTIQADWHETFAGTSGTYHHFEWAVGTGEGKSDILDFEDVGLSGRVYVSDLDLGGLNACYITLRAWKKDGRCCELYAKAHALKGQQCVHCRLVVGDGYVTIKKGESIKRFFEHAEETEEEEDDDSMDKDGNEMDGECSRPQKHAKSPELAREFLLDAATVIFKEQVEKAFREGTARQNAHSIFVCLSLKLLEECLHVAFKEIITLEKQMKLLEEEEKEKREEEERKERKRTKEREKKLRRKERLREKERETRSDPDPDPDPNPNPNFVVPDGSKEESTGNVDDNELDFIEPKDSMVETVENGQDHSDREGAYVEDRNGFPTEHSKSSNQKPKYQNDSQLNQTLKRFDRNGPVYDSDRSVNGSKQLWSRNRGPKYVEKFQSCGCNQQNDYRAKVEPESILDMSKPYYRGNKYNQVEYGHRNCGRPKIKTMSNRNQSGRDFAHVKKVWEPRSNSDSDLMNSTSNLLDSSAATCDEKATANSIVPTQSAKKSVDDDEVESCNTTTTASVNGAKDPSLSGNSSSDNCSSCVSDDASQHSEGLENSPENLKNGFSQPQEVEIERLEQAPETAKTEPLRIEPTKTAQDQDNGKKVNVNLGSQPQGALHQGIQFPLFQPPAMGYYHHSPVSWPTAPANGLFPFPHPNPYLFASPYGYGVNGNTHFFNYGVPEHHVLPVLGPTHLPLFQQFAQTNKLDAKDRARNHEGGLQKEVETRTCLKESPPKAGAKQGNCSSTGFSLFHFGGPVAALQSGDESNTAAEEEIVGDDVSSNHVTKDAIEEYNLFSASNGLKFSFF